MNTKTEALKARPIPTNNDLMLGMNRKNLSSRNMRSSLNARRNEMSGNINESSKSEGIEISTSRKSNLFHPFRMYRYQPYIWILKTASTRKKIVKKWSIRSRTRECVSSGKPRRKSIVELITIAPRITCSFKKIFLKMFITWLGASQIYHYRWIRPTLICHELKVLLS